jgi:tritrans,polycis-undecaprenyl-diphosphate synthase [geranylgeranyl-diphosphate specific]
MRGTSIKALIGKKIDELEKYAIHSNVVRKLAALINRSDFYKTLTYHINKIRDLKLEEEIKKHPLPKHIAIIMDGNRRFARSLGLDPKAGHILGREKLREVLDWCFELGIKILTIYAFSTENFKRSKEEVDALMKLFKQELKNVAKDSRIHKNEVKIRIIGRLDLLPKEIQKSAEYIMNMTKHYNNYLLNVAIAYGGREEIIQAIKQIAQDVKNDNLAIDKIDEKTFSNYLYTKNTPDPDLVFRTSGEERISNFLLWQSAYSELYFSDVYWPALSKRDFLKAIRTFQKRKRRFGE